MERLKTDQSQELMEITWSEGEEVEENGEQMTGEPVWKGCVFLEVGRKEVKAYRWR